METITIGLLGLGTVGKGVVTLLQKQAAKIARTQDFRFKLKSVAVHNRTRHQNDDLPAGTILTEKVTDVVDDPEIQIVIEAMGTIEPAKVAICQAILNGKSIISANKDLLATAGEEILRLAKTAKVDFFYEASVAGGIPILRVLSSSLETDKISQITGIINGTANYVLTAMDREDRDYATALKNAQELGYAEADPTNDVQGIDATYKLIILSRFAFGQSLRLADIPRRGITKISPAQLASAKQFKMKIKLLAVAKEAGHQLYSLVGPAAIPAAEPLAHVNGVQNAIAVQSDALGETTYTGPGAGAAPTANSILSDLLATGDDIVKGDCGREFNNYRKPAAAQSLTTVPQRYLITVEEDRSLTNSNYPDLFQQQTVGPHYWSGLTSVISRDTLEKLLHTLEKNGAKVSYLPIANSWQPVPQE
jgi:homoserine dehydrogenase